MSFKIFMLEVCSHSFKSDWILISSLALLIQKLAKTLGLDICSLQIMEAISLIQREMNAVQVINLHNRLLMWVERREIKYGAQRTLRKKETRLSLIAG